MAMRDPIRRFRHWAVLLAGVPALAAVADPASFLAAERALAAGDRVTFEQLATTLRDDPLHPYLLFAALSRDPDQASEAEITAFLADHPDTPLASRLRRLWLDRLAAAGRWSDYVRVDSPDTTADDSMDPARQCQRLRALLETGQRDAAFDRVAPLWLAEATPPADCDPVIAAWRAARPPPPALVWQRIRQAFAAGDRARARQSGDWLPEGERPWLDLWLTLDAAPNLLNAEPERFAAAHPWPAALLAHGIDRLARADRNAARAALDRWRSVLDADPDAADRALAAVGRALTAAGDPEGLRIWDGMRATSDNLADQEARLRAAIALEGWTWLGDWVRRMPDRVEKRDRWLYWQGRAEDALGQTETALETFRAAAGQRSFWGFMAADRLGLPYRIDHVPTPVDPARLQALEARPALARLRALDALGRNADLRREWRFLTRDLDPPDLRAAARLASLQGWHDQAITTLVRADDWDDLELRFPLAHRASVEARAAVSGIPADWILAIIRQESLFASDAASSAGALGLMQLLPETAREIAPAAGRAPPSRQALLDPEVNIALGAAYLARLQARFGHPALAIAAYNAGPARVMRWLPDQPLAADLWIARIPFRETRGYVERVLAYRILYAARLGREPPRLAALLPPVPANDPARVSQRARSR